MQKLDKKYIYKDESKHKLQTDNVNEEKKMELTNFKKDLNNKINFSLVSQSNEYNSLVSHNSTINKKPVIKKKLNINAAIGGKVANKLLKTNNIISESKFTFNQYVIATPDSK